MTHLSRIEIGKDALQDVVTATASAVGQLTVIATSTVKEVATALGGFATELFEIGDSALRARADNDD